MRSSTDVLLRDLRELSPGEGSLAPTSVAHRLNGKCTLTWHVDDDDDRYIEATDSLYSDHVVLVARDGLLGTLEAVELVHFSVIREWVKNKLAFMTTVRSPRGRRT